MGLSRTHNSAETALDKFCIDQGAKIKLLLSSAGKNDYNNYDKARFRRTCDTLKKGDYAAKALTEPKRVALKLKTTNQIQDSVTVVTNAVPDFRKLRDDVSGILKKTVVSKALAELTGDEALAEWVQTGIGLHTGDKASPTCRFCTQPLTPERLKALEAHFNTEYQELLDEVTAAEAKQTACSGELAKWKLPVKDSFYSHLRSRAVQPLAQLSTFTEEAETYLGALRAVLETKRTKPFVALQLEELIKARVPDAEAAAKNIVSLNALVTEHNDECANFVSTVEKARKELEEGVVAEIIPDFISKSAALSSAKTNLNESVTKLGAIEKEIAELEKEISESIQPTIELTEELASYLGQCELKFEPKGKGYAVTRAGLPALHLSEGEKTAIAFLYFLKSLQDKSFVIAKSIVVIDDPISSLDANALFCAFGFMKARTKDAGQLIILTHNFAFFRQVKNWLYYMIRGKSKAAAQKIATFYMLQCATSAGIRSAQLTPLDPLLYEYESEYHYLFYRIHAETVKPATTNLADFYSLPNMARRLLEAFLSFRFPTDSGELRKQLDRVTFPEARVARLLRFIHTYSHDGKISEPEHDLSVLAETPQILKSLMELIEAEDPKHYAEMVAVLAAAAADR